MNILKNVVLSGYFYTTPEFRFKRKVSYNFWGNTVCFTGNSIFLTLCRNIYYHIIQRKINESLKTFLQTFLSEKGVEVILVSLEIVNLHCALTLQCDQEKLLGDILPEYRKEFEIEKVVVVDEDKAPSIEIPFDDLTKAQFINVRIITPNSKGSKKYVSVKFVKRKNKTTAVTLILTECSPDAVAVVNFFTKVAKELAMYRLSKGDVLEKITTCLKTLHKNKTQQPVLYAKLKEVSKIRGFHSVSSNSNRFAKHLVEILFGNNSGDEVALKDLKDVGDFFHTLAEILQCKLSVSTPEGLEPERLPGLQEIYGHMRIDLLAGQTPGNYTIFFAICEISPPIVAPLVHQSEAGVAEAFTPNQSPNFDLFFEKSAQQQQYSADAVKQEADRIDLATRNNNNNWGVQQQQQPAPALGQSPFIQLMGGETIKSSCSSCSSSSSCSANSSDSESSSTCMTPLHKRESCVTRIRKELEKETSANKRRRARQIKHLNENVHANPRGFSSPYPQLTESLLRKTNNYVENMEANIDTIYSVYTDIHILALRFVKTLSRVRIGPNPEDLCGVCPLHCPESIAHINLRSAGRPPEGSCKRPSTKRGGGGEKRARKPKATTTSAAAAAAATAAAAAAADGKKKKKNMMMMAN